MIAKTDFDIGDTVFIKDTVFKDNKPTNLCFPAKGKINSIEFIKPFKFGELKDLIKPVFHIILDSGEYKRAEEDFVFKTYEEAEESCREIRRKEIEGE